ncbi:amino acid ABC transporter ATP-binding protein [Mesorhizobium sp. M1312]|uniref:amino acid ABC transporter ATP-binding protein n=1 Tax=unclassified Mesorhizobium TaxID=325217 RepID=UPI00333D431C
MNETNAKPVIEARHLGKRFGSLVALSDVSLSACSGEVIAILGPSGSGKSTLLRCFNFLEVADSGAIVLREEQFECSKFLNPGRAQQARLVHLRARVGMVFQSFNLWPHRTAEANIMEGPMHVLGLTRAKAQDQARRLLAKVGLADRAEHFPSQLSGGQQQRVAIARALAMEPEVLLFDEPTSALDPELVGEVLGVMRQLAKEGRTMLIVTHEVAFARDVASRIVFMKDGSICEAGPPGRLLTAPETPQLASFLSRFNKRH